MFKKIGENLIEYPLTKNEYVCLFGELFTCWWRKNISKTTHLCQILLKEIFLNKFNLSNIRYFSCLVSFIIVLPYMFIFKFIYHILRYKMWFKLIQIVLRSKVPLSNIHLFFFCRVKNEFPRSGNLQQLNSSCGLYFWGATFS